MWPYQSCQRGKQKPLQKHLLKANPPPDFPHQSFNPITQQCFEDCHLLLISNKRGRVEGRAGFVGLHTRQGATCLDIQSTTCASSRDLRKTVQIPQKWKGFLWNLGGWCCYWCNVLAATLLLLTLGPAAASLRHFLPPRSPLVPPRHPILDKQATQIQNQDVMQKFRKVLALGALFFPSVVVESLSFGCWEYLSQS